MEPCLFEKGDLSKKFYQFFFEHTSNLNLSKKTWSCVEDLSSSQYRGQTYIWKIFISSLKYCTNVSDLQPPTVWIAAPSVCLVLSLFLFPPLPVFITRLPSPFFPCPFRLPCLASFPFACFPSLPSYLVLKQFIQYFLSNNHLYNYTKRIIRLSFSEYFWIIPQTSSQGLFHDILYTFSEEW